MKISTAEKLKLIRESERLSSLPETAKMLGLNRDALWRYENGKTIPNADVITSIISHPRFEKYALWFVTGKTAPEAGQIAPALYDPKNYELTEEKKNECL
ncbi:helix-turn-helix domain-containing protein [Morganella morganii]|uniref:helix-turn-helix domain-containing protein n=1 Tax=Morganella morganii TaxID=582 RepID=UPI00159F3FE6|nr:helix-turn-helix transcriptional regulator [Morganella morganii]QLB46454.1 helix-turn-helix transcriptional regulator [Morganella morganii]HDS7364667.1 helix-turn-helix transcriptional regulator [Morganella morganii subsp. morganii]HEO9696028.1 helix-turn-helix transcriptional regulator [Morganella morganii subsp. morganii]